jgi:hypothetical protein
MRDQVEIQENLRSIPVGKNILHAKRQDPYGFWTIHFERGEIPAELKGTFTSFPEAWKRIEVYLAKRQDDESPLDNRDEVFHGSS